MLSHTILYVENQNRSKKFYKEVLLLSPSLDVSGMTEFTINSGSVLGIMPINSIQKLLDDKLHIPYPPGPAVELYLIVPAPLAYHNRSLLAGAKKLSPLKLRDWGHYAAYSLTPDNTVLVFATTINKAIT